MSVVLTITMVAGTTIHHASADNPGALSCEILEGWLLPGQAACLVGSDVAMRSDGYVLRVEAATKAHYQAFYDDAIVVAEQLSRETGIPFRVGEMVPLRQPPAPGEIILRPDSYVDGCEGIACAGGKSAFSWPWVVEHDRIEGGQVWFRSDIHNQSAEIQLLVIRHEVAHVLGLWHYDLVGTQRSINGTTVTSQAMQWDVRFTSVRDYQAGDLAGLRYLADYHRLSPTAKVTRLGTVPGGVIVNGVGTDPSDENSRLRLRVVIDGGPAVLTYFGTTLAATVGPHEVCVTFVNVGAGADVDGGCLNTTVTRAAPKSGRAAPKTPTSSTKTSSTKTSSTKTSSTKTSSTKTSTTKTSPATTRPT